MSSDFWRRGPLRRLRGEPEVMFGQVREDTALEGSLARGRCLCIASGGETAFDLLLGGATHVVAVDVNPAQVWLVELKTAIIGRLPHDQVVTAMTGDARNAFNEIREQLSVEARVHFEGRPHALQRGLENCGKVDLMLLRLGRLFQSFVHSRPKVEGLLSQPTLHDQSQTFDAEWDTWRWRIAMSLLSRRSSVRLGFGSSAVRDISDPDMRSFGREIGLVLREVEACGNPYVWQALLGRFPPGVLPFWLAPEGFASLRSRLDRLELRVEDVADSLRSASTPYDVVCLSNILDVTEASYPEVMARALTKGTAPGSLVVARSFFPFRKNLVELSQGALASKETPEWTDRSFFCRNVSLMEAAG